MPNDKPMQFIKVTCIPDSAMFRAFMVPGGFEVELTQTGNVWVAIHKETGVSGFDYDKQKALENCLIDFACCYHQIAEESDEKLTEDARKLKQKLLAVELNILDLPTFVDRLAHEQIDLEPEITRMVDENFWDLL